MPIQKKLKRLKLPKNPKRVLVIDPGTKSTGWSLWVNGQLSEHGTVQASNYADPWYQRLAEIGAQYANLAKMLKPDSVYVERLVRNTHIYVHYCVGHLCGLFAAQRIPCSPTIAIKSWEKHVRWNHERRPLKKYFKSNWTTYRSEGKPLEDKHFRGIKSEDEAAAIGMGMYLHEEGDKS